MNHIIIYDTIFESLFKHHKNQDIEESHSFSDPKLSKLLQRLSQKNLFGSFKLK